MFGKVRLAFTLIIIIGIAVYFYWTYQAAQQLEIKDKRIVGIAPKTVTTWEVTFEIVFNNPTDKTIEVDKLTYKIYLNDTYLGEGVKNDLVIEPGEVRQTFVFDFDVRDVSNVIVKILGGKVVKVTVKGKVTVPAKVFGLFTWTHITLPYEKSSYINLASGSHIPIPPTTTPGPSAPTTTTPMPTSTTPWMTNPFNSTSTWSFPKP